MGRRRLAGAAVVVLAYLQWSRSLLSSDGQPNMGILGSGAANILVPDENMLHTVGSYEVEHIAGSQVGSGSYNPPYAICTTS